MINRDRFFLAVKRSEIFGKALTQGQVDGMNAVLDEWESRRIQEQAKGEAPPLTHLAYCLATDAHETAYTMQPIAEYGRGKGKKYGRPDPRTGQTYFGRGLVQLTWYENYLKAGTILGINLVHKPDLAMQMDTAVKIMFDGMQLGWFAGDKKGRHTLSRYFNSRVTDPIGARRIINGTDKAHEIAGIFRQFHTALLTSSTTAEPETMAPPPKPKPITQSTTILAEAGKGATVAGGLFAALQGIDWRVVAVVGAVALIGLGWWTIRERIKARETYGR